MIKSSTIAGAATLALALVPALALTTTAYAAPVTVKVSDLNVSSPEGARALKGRINIAAHKICAADQGLSRQASCRESVRAEVHEQLAARAAATTLASR